MCIWQATWQFWDTPCTRRHEHAVRAALAQDQASVCKARVRICLYESSRDSTISSSFWSKLASRRATPLEGEPGVSGLRASPIILRPEISRPLLIRRRTTPINPAGFVPHKLQGLPASGYSSVARSRVMPIYADVNVAGSSTCSRSLPRNGTPRTIFC